jgi:hypothetical protein
MGNKKATKQGQQGGWPYKTGQQGGCKNAWAGSKPGKRWEDLSPEEQARREQKRQEPTDYRPKWEDLSPEDKARRIRNQKESRRRWKKHHPDGWMKQEIATCREAEWLKDFKKRLEEEPPEEESRWRKDLRTRLRKRLEEGEKTKEKTEEKTD